MPRSNLTDVASDVKRDPSTISAIWRRYVAAVELGVVGGEWKSRIKQHCGRKWKNRDELREKLVRVPMEDRTVERRVAATAGVSRHLVRQAVKEGMLKHRTTFIKPVLAPENKLQRVQHTLSFINDSTLEFEPMHNVVHVDEKWFYSDRDKRSYLVLEGEEPPPRLWKSKRFVPKTMFLTALARPRTKLNAQARIEQKAPFAPVISRCSRELYQSAVALLAASDRGSALLFGNK
ncbi:unnamed protein product [Phytophthora fragariaefolia]|uniref:Unnamed protein product n=1 Tax=Phytophthora fragariaefolia TaxID=1490495 RepID=A0A9W6XLT1_9STRA|nr:unnamed protein product [Phytophthora fragariaefolia]